MQECPPSDTLSIDPVQDLWNIPMENQWNKIEVMTWNIKDFPISNSTINEGETFEHLLQADDIDGDDIFFIASTITISSYRIPLIVFVSSFEYFLFFLFKIFSHS